MIIKRNKLVEKAMVRNPIINVNSNLVPDLYEKKEDCCGCAACFSICPQNAIKMVADEEGFLYPSIDAKLCIKCKQCIRVCPIKIADAIQLND